MCEWKVEGRAGGWWWCLKQKLWGSSEVVDKVVWYAASLFLLKLWNTFQTHREANSAWIIPSLLHSITTRLILHNHTILAPLPKTHQQHQPPTQKRIWQPSQEVTEELWLLPPWPWLPLLCCVHNPSWYTKALNGKVFIWQQTWSTCSIWMFRRSLIANRWQDRQQQGGGGVGVVFAIPILNAFEIECKLVIHIGQDWYLFVDSIHVVSYDI